MNIERKLGYERWLLDTVKTWLQAQPRAAGIHVSDLLYPLKAYWKRMDPQPMTDDEAGYFVAGQGHHFVLESIIAGANKTGKADGGTYEWEGIFYSPDLETPHPLEIKTSRARFGPKSEGQRTLASEYEHYLKQLKSYMAIRNDPVGDLLVFYLALQRSDEDKRTRPEFRWYRVELAQHELDWVRAWLRETKDKLEKALLAKDPTWLEACPTWLCRGCAWATQCPGAPAGKEKP